jgi:hypothetical protein
MVNPAMQQMQAMQQMRMAQMQAMQQMRMAQMQAAQRQFLAAQQRAQAAQRQQAQAAQRQARAVPQIPAGGAMNRLARGAVQPHSQIPTLMERMQANGTPITAHPRRVVAKKNHVGFETLAERAKEKGMTITAHPRVKATRTTRPSANGSILGVPWWGAYDPDLAGLWSELDPWNAGLYGAFGPMSDVYGPDWGASFSYGD